MAKQKKRPVKKVTRRQIHRHKKDEELQRILIWIAGAVLAIIVAVLGYGLYMETVVKPGRPVAKAGAVEINTQAYQARVRYQRILTLEQIEVYQGYLDKRSTDKAFQALIQQFEATKASLENQLSPDMTVPFGKQVLDQMVEEEFIHQEAAARGLTVSAAEIDQRVEQFLGYDRAADVAASASEAVTETQSVMTEAEYRQGYANFKTNVLEVSGLSEDDLRRMLETELLKTALKAQLGENAETEADQVQFTYLAIIAQEDAGALWQRIEQGEDIATLMEEINQNDNEQNQGGVLPWMTAEQLSGQVGPELATLAFDTPIGEAAGPVQGSDGLYYIIYVEGHEVRPLDDYLLQQAQEQEYQKWLVQQQAEKVEYLDWQEVTPGEP
ncbi:MAG: SurA N-terminal domain-containing protein [Chloroflexota bacterium]|nr:SurA N-terminal domain-containing protein [Chloroflexota bacterium]